MMMKEKMGGKFLRAAKSRLEIAGTGFLLAAFLLSMMSTAVNPGE